MDGICGTRAGAGPCEYDKEISYGGAHRDPGTWKVIQTQQDELQRNRLTHIKPDSITLSQRLLRDLKCREI